jgi:hypothetical protein
MFIIEQRYGNDGYTFWFKLLELLGKTQGHCLDLEKVSTLEFLASTTRVAPETCTDILNLLARLEAIDPELWKSKIVWSENFVIGIADAYRNRVLETPKRPDILRQKSPITPQSEVGNPQTKLEDTKGKERRRKDISPSKTKASIPENFTISDAVRTWATKKGFDRLEDHLESFKDRAVMKGYQYIDWDAAFKTAIREDWGKIRQNLPGPSRQEPEGFNALRESSRRRQGVE